MYRLYNGIEIPTIGFGTFPLKDELLSLVPSAIEDGCRLFDTAWKYKNECQLGKAIKTTGQTNIFIESKLNIKQLYPYSWLHKLRSIIPPLHSVENLYDGSCKRLGLERLNLYLLHYPYPTFKSIWKEMVNLYNKGRVDSIGVCSFSIKQLQSIIDETGFLPMVNQIEIHPYHTNKDTLSFCKSNGIHVLAISPLGGGFLTSQLMTDDVLVGIAKNCKKSVSQIILRWLIQLGVTPVFKTSNVNRIKENLNVFDFELSLQQMRQIDLLNRDESILLLHGKKK